MVATGRHRLSVWQTLEEGRLVTARRPTYAGRRRQPLSSPSLKSFDDDKKPARVGWFFYWVLGLATVVVDGFADGIVHSDSPGETAVAIIKFGHLINRT